MDPGVHTRWYGLSIYIYIKTSLAQKDTTGRPEGTCPLTHVFVSVCRGGLEYNPLVSSLSPLKYKMGQSRPCPTRDD